MTFITTQGYLAESRGRGVSPVLVHRRVMEQKLGRPLGSHEIVHHLNTNPLDNRPENLALVSRSTHPPLHRRAGNRVRRARSGRFYAYRHENGRQVTVGTFDTQEEAQWAS